MPAPSPASAALHAFRLRLAIAAFVDGVARALFVVAGLMVLGLLSARCLGHDVPAQWWWFSALVPVLGFASWQVVRQRLSPALLAQHVDRRLGLHGLLLCAQDGVPIDAAWQQQVTAALAALPQALPVVRWRQLWWRPLAAALLLAIVVTLPASEVANGPQVAANAALQRLEEQLRELEQGGALPVEVDQDLQRRLRELAPRIADRDATVWRALDEMGQKIERERRLQSGPAAPSAAPPTPRDAESVSVQQLARAAELLAKAGRLDDLAAMAKDALQQARLGNGTFDPSLLPSDPAALRKLAEAVAAVGLEIDPSKLLASISPAQMAELLRLAQGLARQLGGLDPRLAMDMAKQLAGAFGGSGTAGAGKAARSGAASGSTAAGGGTSAAGGGAHGPGGASLLLTEHTEGSAAKPFELPAGDAKPGEWVPSDPQRSDPEVHPTDNHAPGGEGSVGTGGATWQLRLAPRHRAVVQRFFDTANGGGK